MIRTYSELRRRATFEDRFKYLSLRGNVGDSTFGFERHLNQDFYRSREWKLARRDVIVRDNGCDLGVEGYEIPQGARIYVHHMNPMRPEDIEDGSEDILNPEFLICVTLQTHNAVHYGDPNLLPRQFTPRHAGDTTLWRKR